jgi:hypothetical protein
MKLTIILILVILINGEELKKGSACPITKNLCENEGICLIFNQRFIVCSCDSGFTGIFTDILIIK